MQLMQLMQLSVSKVHPKQQGHVALTFRQVTYPRTIRCMATADWKRRILSISRVDRSVCRTQHIRGWTVERAPRR